MKKLLAICVVVSVVGGGMVATAQSGYSISISGSTTDIPETTISFGGNDHTITEVGVRDEAGSITVDATAPADATYDVNLYNSDGEVVDGQRYAGGTSTTTLDLGSPGTYGAAVYDSEVKDLTGVVVAGYEVELTIPDTATQGESVDATVELTDVGGGTIERVEVVLMGSETIRSTATTGGGSTYTTTISLDDARAGEYDAYGVVFSPEEFDNGENEIIGLSSGQEFTVEDGDDGDSNGSTSDPTPAPGDGTTRTENGMGTATAHGTATDGEPTDTAGTPTRGDTATTSTDDGTGTGDGSTPTATEGAGTDLSPTAGTDTTGSDGDGTGLGSLIAVIAILAAIGAARRR
jgi:hypothetical protein